VRADHDPALLGTASHTSSAGRMRSIASGTSEYETISLLPKIDGRAHGYRPPTIRTWRGEHGGHRKSTGRHDSVLNGNSRLEQLSTRVLRHLP
jgi:hypothetical protein